MAALGDAYGAGLRSLVALLLHEAHVGADAELFKAVVQYAVAMEVDFASVGSFEKAIIAQQFTDARLGRFLMRLYVAAQFTDIVFELAPYGVEGFANRRGQPFFVLPVGHQLLARNGQPDPYCERPALAMVVDRSLDGHIAADDLVEIGVQRRGLFAYFSLKGFRQGEVAGGYAQWSLHLELFLLPLPAVCPCSRAFATSNWRALWKRQRHGMMRPKGQIGGELCGQTSHLAGAVGTRRIGHVPWIKLAMDKGSARWESWKTRLP